MSFVTHQHISEALGWPDHELRVLRRLVECPVQPRRLQGPDAPVKCNVFALEETIDWLKKILPRLAPADELALRNFALET